MSDNIEEKDIKQQKKDTQEAKNKNKGNKKTVVFIVCGVALVVIIALVVFFLGSGNGNGNVEKIDGKKIDVSSINLSMSDDYKYFNNSIEDFVAVLSNDFKDNYIGVKKATTCESADGYGNYCYKVLLDNGDKVYAVGTTNNYFEKIIVVGNLNDIKYTGKVLGTIARLYITNLDGDKFEDEIDSTFLLSENLERRKGINYVYDHMKFEWSRNNNSYSLTFSVCEYENNESYKETDDYKTAYVESIKSGAEDEIKDVMDKYHTLDSFEVNSSTGLADVKLKYNKTELSKFVCASDTQYMAKSLVGSSTIGSLQFECVNSSGSFYFVKIENINSITEDKINSNTKYFDKNYKQENTNLDKLKAQIVTDYKKSCASYKYKDVLRNPEKYTGKKAYWFGEVLQVVDKTELYATYRVGVSCTKYKYIGGYSCPDAIYVTYFGEGNFIEDDIVKMYGTMNGTETYTTVLGASVTIPKFTAQYIDLQ